MATFRQIGDFERPVATENHKWRHGDFMANFGLGLSLPHFSFSVRPDGSAQRHLEEIISSLGGVALPSRCCFDTAAIPLRVMRSCGVRKFQSSLFSVLFRPRRGHVEAAAWGLSSGVRKRDRNVDRNSGLPKKVAAQNHGDTLAWQADKTTSTPPPVPSNCQPCGAAGTRNTAGKAERSSALPEANRTLLQDVQHFVSEQSASSRVQ